MVHVRVLGGRVVTPDVNVVDFLNGSSGALSNLADSSVLVKSSQSREVSLWDGGSVVRGNEGVGVGGVSNNTDFASLLGNGVHGGTLSLEDLSVSLEEISSLHTGSSRSGTNHHNDIGVLETNKGVSGGNDLVDAIVGSIVEFHHESLESSFSLREFQKL